MDAGTTFLLSSVDIHLWIIISDPELLKMAASLFSEKTIAIGPHTIVALIATYGILILDCSLPVSRVFVFFANSSSRFRRAELISKAQAIAPRLVRS